ncbi:hypothetical protein ACLB2K_052097 [Fragaria x ananassa]
MRATSSLSREGHLASHLCELFCCWTAYPADKKNDGWVILPRSHAGYLASHSGRVISPRSHVGYLTSNPCELPRLSPMRFISPRSHASYLTSHHMRVILPRIYTTSRAVEQHDFLVTFPTDGAKCFCINPEAMWNHGGTKLVIKRQSWARDNDI